MLLGKEKAFDVFLANVSEEIIAFLTINQCNIKAITINKNQSIIIKNNSLIAMTKNVTLPHI
jgi:uncharacterized protein (AIM24 family)